MKNYFRAWPGALRISLMVQELYIGQLRHNLKGKYSTGELIWLFQTEFNLTKRLRSSKILEKDFPVMKES